MKLGQVVQEGKPANLPPEAKPIVEQLQKAMARQQALESAEMPTDERERKAMIDQWTEIKNEVDQLTAELLSKLSETA
ncbi:MAG: hypothetical protein ACPG8W_08360 [Candidatus Promineifilaceae bacterium]